MRNLTSSETQVKVLASYEMQSTEDLDLEVKKQLSEDIESFNGSNMW